MSATEPDVENQEDDGEYERDMARSWLHQYHPETPFAGTSS